MAQTSLFTKTALLDVIVMGSYRGVPGMGKLISDVDQVTATAAEKAKRNLSILASAAMVPGVVALGIVGESLKQYGAFTKMTEQVRGQTNITTAQLGTMRTQIRGFMREYGSSATDTASAFRRAYNTQSEYFYKGMSAHKAAAKQAADAYAVANEAAKASVATGDPASGIANTVGSVLHAYQLEASAMHGHLTNAQIVMAEMHTASADANTTLAKFSQNLSGVLPQAKQLGVSLATIGGMYGTLTKGGVTGPQAQTQVRTLFNELLHQTPLVQRNLNALSNQTGIDMTQAFSAQGVQSMGLPKVLRMFNEALAREKAQGRNPLTVLSSIITQRRGLSGMTQLLSDQGLSEGDQIAREVELSGQGKYKNAQGKWVSAGWGKNAQGQRYHRTVTDVMASAMMNSLPGQEMKLRGTLQDLEIQMGKTFAGPATQALKTLVPLLQKLDLWMSKPANAHKIQQWVKIAGIVGGFGAGLKLVIGSLEVMNKLADLSPWMLMIGAGVLLYKRFSLVRNVVNGVATAMWGVAKAIASFAAAHPIIKNIGLGIAGVTIVGLGLAIAVVKIIKGFRTLGSTFMSLKHGAKDSFSTMDKNPFTWVKGAIDGLGKLTGLVKEESNEADKSAESNNRLAKSKMGLATGAKDAAEHMRALGLAIPGESEEARKAAMESSQRRKDINQGMNDIQTLQQKHDALPSGSRYDKQRADLMGQIGSKTTEVNTLLEQQHSAEQIVIEQKKSVVEAERLAKLDENQARQVAIIEKRQKTQLDTAEKLLEIAVKRLKLLGQETRNQRDLNEAQQTQFRNDRDAARQTAGPTPSPTHSGVQPISAPAITSTSATITPQMVPLYATPLQETPIEKKNFWGRMVANLRGNASPQENIAGVDLADANARRLLASKEQDISTYSGKRPQTPLLEANKAALQVALSHGLLPYDPTTGRMMSKNGTTGLQWGHVESQEYLKSDQVAPDDRRKRLIFESKTGVRKSGEGATSLLSGYTNEFGRLPTGIQLQEGTLNGNYGSEIAEWAKQTGNKEHQYHVARWGDIKSLDQIVENYRQDAYRYHGQRLGMQRVPTAMEAWTPYKYDEIYRQLGAQPTSQANLDAIRKFNTNWYSAKRTAVEGGPTVASHMDDALEKMTTELGKLGIVIDKDLEKANNSLPSGTRLNKKEMSQFRSSTAKYFDVAENDPQLESRMSQLIALGSHKESYRELNQILAGIDRYGGSLPEKMFKIGEEIDRELAAGISSLTPELEKAGEELINKRKGAMHGVEPGSPTASGRDYSKIGGKIGSYLAKGLASATGLMKNAGNELVTAGVEQPMAHAASVMEIEGKHLVQAEIAGIDSEKMQLQHALETTQSGAMGSHGSALSEEERMSGGGRFGRFAGHISRIGGAVGGGLMTAQMMDQMIDPNGKMGISKDMNKLFNNPVMNAVNTAMMMQGMFGFGGAGHLKKFAGKIPGLGRLFRPATSVVGDASGLGGLAGDAAGLAGAGGVAADAGAVGGLEAAGAGLDATGVGLPVGIALALAGGGLLAYQHRNQLGKWKNTFLAHPGKALGQAGSAIGSGLGNVGNTIGHGLKEGFTKILPNFINFMGNKLGHGLSAIGGLIKGNWQTILAHLFLPTLIWNALPAKWRDAATKAAQGFVHGIGGMTHAVASTVHNIINTITSPFKHLNLMKMGENMVSGFTKGLSGRGHDLKKAAGDLIHNVLFHFGFHSPSEAGVDPEQFGSNFGAAWAKGFSNSQTDMVKSAKDNMKQLLKVLTEEQDKAMKSQEMMSKELVTGHVMPLHVIAQKHKAMKEMAALGAAAGGIGATFGMFHPMVAAKSGGGDFLQKIYNAVYSISQIMEGKKPVLHMRYTDTVTHKAVSGALGAMSKTLGHGHGRIGGSENVYLRGSLLGTKNINDVNATLAKIVSNIKSYLDFTPKNKHNDNADKWGSDFITAFINAIGGSTAQSNMLTAIQGDFDKIAHWLHFKPANKNNDDPGKWASDFISFYTGSLGGSNSKQLTSSASSTLLDSIKYYLYVDSSGKNKNGDDWKRSAQNIVDAINSTLTNSEHTLKSTGHGMSTSIETGGKFYQMGKDSMKWTVRGLSDYVSNNGSKLNTIGTALAAAVAGGINSSGSGNINIGSYSGTWKTGVGGVPFSASNFGSFSNPTVAGANRQLTGVVGAWSDRLLGEKGAAYDTDFMSKTGAPTNVVLPGGPNAKWTFVKMTAPDPTGGIGEVWKTPMGHEVLFWHMGRANTGPSTAESVINANPVGRMAYNDKTKKWENLRPGQQYRGGTTVGQSGYDNGVNHLCVVTGPNGRADLQWLTTQQMGQMKSSALPRILQQYGGAIVSASNATGISSSVISSQIMQESSGVASATTQGFDGKDIGLMQYGPAEARQAGGQYTYNPTQNIMTGTKFLNYLLKGPAHGNLRTALAMYNGGPGNPNYTYADQILNRAKNYSGGVGGGATGPGGSYGHFGATEYNPNTDPLSPTIKSTTPPVHYVPFNAPAASFNPHLDTGQTSSLSAQHNFMVARGQVSAMVSRYGLAGIGENSGLLKKYKQLLDKEYRYFADIQIANYNAKLHSTNTSESQSKYNAYVANLQNYAQGRAKTAVQRAEAAAARAGYTSAEDQLRIANQTLSVYKQMGGKGGSVWAEAFATMGNKAAAAFINPFMNAIKNAASATAKMAIARIETQAQTWRNAQGGHLTAAQSAIVSTQIRMAHVNQAYTTANQENAAQGQFYTAKENDIKQFGVHYYNPKTHYRFNGPGLAFLDQVTKGSTSKMTPAERSQWLKYEHEKITETAMVANTKAQGQTAAYVNDVRAGEFGTNHKQQQILIKLAKERLAQSIKQNNQIAISNWHLAQIKATGAAGSQAYLGTQGRVLAVRVIGHCADGSVPGSATTHARPKPTSSRATTTTHTTKSKGTTTKTTTHTSATGATHTTVATSHDEHAWQMAHRGEPVSHVKADQLQNEAKLQNTHLSKMSGNMQKMYDEQRQSNLHLNSIKGGIHTLSRQFEGLAKELTKKTPTHAHGTENHHATGHKINDPAFKGMKIGVGNH